MKNVFFVFLIFFFLNVNSNASVKKKLIKNLESIDNILFNFKQTISGKDEHGNCTIEFPKRIFCLYKFRHNKILVSNGKSLVIKSDKNNQYYRYNLEKTPLSLILNKEKLISLIKDNNIKILDDKYYLISVSKDNYDLSIFFDKKDLNLMGWQTEDIYQNLSITQIYDIKINKKIYKKIFILP